MSTFVSSSSTTFVDITVQACDAVEVCSGDTKMKLQHMCRMFQMYSVGEFATGCDIWLAGICRYLHEAYSSLTIQILQLLTTVGRVMYASFLMLIADGSVCRC